MADLKLPAQLHVVGAFVLFAAFSFTRASCTPSSRRSRISGVPCSSWGSGIARERAAPSVERLHPAYFAMVMATGIVSVACKLLGLGLLADVLLAVNVVTYVVLWALTVARVARYPRRVLEDLVDHQRGVGFFTMVAGSSVLGVQCVLVREELTGAVALLLLAVVLWVVLTYGDLHRLHREGRRSRPWRTGSTAAGSWPSWPRSRSRTWEGSLPRRLPGPHDTLLFFSLVFWLCGGMLYIWMISLIFYRYTFFRFSPSDLMPPYWVNMGAMAISTLAGTTLIANVPRVGPPRADAALPTRLHRAVLGDRHVVDPDARDPRRLAARLPEVRDDLRPALLGSGLPARHVQREHAPAGSGPGPALPPLPAARLPVRGARRLERDVRRAPEAPLPLRKDERPCGRLALPGAARRALRRGSSSLVLAACEPTNRGYSPNQPVVYSHAVHAGALKIPCQYCHYGAERGRNAGIPPAAICMNCHAQVQKDHPEVVKVKKALAEGRAIEWVRVHRLPDFVLLRPLDPRDEGRRLPDLPRSGRDDGPGDPGERRSPWAGASTATGRAANAPGRRSERFPPPRPTG